jgi:hypothetical protein
VNGEPVEGRGDKSTETALILLQVGQGLLQLIGHTVEAPAKLT